MDLKVNHPTITDLPLFLRSLIEALEQLHATRQPHGAISGARIKDWLNSSGTFDTKGFELARRPIEEFQNSDDPFLNDIQAFTELSIDCVTGISEVQDKTEFKAALYRGKGWSDTFLDQLEAYSCSGGSELKTISEISGALKSNPESSAAVEKKSPAKQQKATHDKLSIQLRNGTVGRSYEVEPGAIANAIAVQCGDNPDQAFVSHLQLPSDCGLIFDETTGGIKGIPTTAFEKELSLDYVPSRSAKSIPFTIRLLINPDPATLWKDLPQPTDAPFQKDVSANTDQSLGPFRVISASRRGRSHANKGEFRDDDYSIGYAPETDWLIVVVADGAGSAKYSRRGSQIACEVARNRLLAVLNSKQHNQAEASYATHKDWEHVEVKNALRQVMYDAALLAHHKLREEVSTTAKAISPAPTLRNFDTTLILLLLKRVEAGCIAATFAIGDGGAGVMTTPENGIALTRPDGGEHAGQTIFLTFDSTLKPDEENLNKRFHLVVSSTFTGALVMTDGITDPKFPSEAAYTDPSFWGGIWGELQPHLSNSAALLDWMGFFSPGNHDDRTLVAILPVS